MNIFTVVFLCIQAFLVQNVIGLCTSRAAVAAEPGLIAPGIGAPYGFGSSFAYGGLSGCGNSASIPGAAPFGYRAGLPELAYPGYAELASYGGIGEGNVAVAGELPVVGNTALAGQVPIMGAVRFDGVVPAAGSVAIEGRCACNCGADLGYLF